jgi:transcriptional regulator with XRE-family HTH domain
MDIGREIRRLREERGWSQAKLAGAADMGTSGISQIETGARNPSAVTLSKIAEALEVEVADLFPKDLSPRLPLEITGEAHLSGTGKLTAAGVVREIMQVMDERRKEKISDEEVVERIRDLIPREPIPA